MVDPRNGGPKSMERQLVVVKSTCICACLLERRTCMAYAKLNCAVDSCYKLAQLFCDCECN